VLRFENMPKAAQFLPDRASLKDERGVDLEVWQCAGCGLVQLNNKPVAYYKDVIRAAEFSDEMMRFREKQFSEFLQEYGLQGKKIIEIGCGSGEYLGIMQRCGTAAYGLENTVNSVSRCVKRGLKVSRGFIESSDQKLPHAPFNAFFILNFLEHLPDPNTVLQGICNNLAGAGVGLIEVPNFDMIVRECLFSEFTRDHLFYFTKDTLSYSLKLNGLDIVSCKEVWHDYILSAVVKKREKSDLTNFIFCKSRLREDLNRYIDRFGDKRVAVWGAGHQALALISLADLASRIRYVVDSAIFKQGKYTPATHIPIVHPDTLASDPVEAVIIIAGGYSDEIAMIIKQKYNSNLNVTILRENRLEIIN
jgi:SAM-dependent methyltransferase